MNGEQQLDSISFTVDENNLYREESITDLKVASIRKLVPIKSDGTDDPGRKAVFIGHSQLMSPQGPLPIQARLNADNISDAMKEFPGAMKQALAGMVEKLKQYQDQQARQKQQGESRIIVPKM